MIETTARNQPRPSARAGMRFGAGWIFAILLIAALARLFAIGWNDRLFGDVNLFALVAREWSENGRLEYPGKLDFTAEAPYRTLSSPVSQHPVGWAWMAGSLAKLSGMDAWQSLRALTLGMGLLTVWLGWLLARALREAHFPDAKWIELCVAAALALHPALVDYSANGSAYIGLAASALAVAAASAERRWSPVARGALAGVGAALAFNLHGVGLLLFPAALAALLLAVERGRATAVASCAVSCALLAGPAMAWGMARLGQPFGSASKYYRLGSVGASRLVSNEAGVRFVAGGLGSDSLFELAVRAAGTSCQYVFHLTLECGLAGLALALVGAWALFRGASSGAARRRLAAVALAALSVALPCLVWPTFKFRFLIPMLPFALIAAAAGWDAARRGACGKCFQRLADWLCGGAVVGVLALWAAHAAHTGSPAKYYSFDAEHLPDYRSMREAVAAIADAPPGPMLAIADSLDGGIEAAWLHRMPLIAARGFDADVMRRLAGDFNARYLWLDVSQEDFALRTFPGSQPLFSNGRHAVRSLEPYAGGSPVPQRR